MSFCKKTNLHKWVRLKAFRAFCLVCIQQWLLRCPLSIEFWNGLDKKLDLFLSHYFFAFRTYCTALVAAMAPSDAAVTT